MAPHHMKLHIPTHVMEHADRVRAARGLHEDRTEILRQATTIGLLMLAANAPPAEDLSETERTWTAHHVYPHVLAAMRFLTAQGMMPVTTAPTVAPAPMPTTIAPPAADEMANNAATDTTAGEFETTPTTSPLARSGVGFDDDD